MIDRGLALFGLALAVIFFFWPLAPGGLPKMPSWLFCTGIGVGILIFGIGLGLIIADLRGDRSAPMPISTVTATPRLRLAMIGANIFIPDAPDLRNRLTGIALKAKVWNTGAPSVVTKWALFVIPQNATPAIAQLTAIPDSLRVGGALNSVVIRASDSLVAKTDTTQVAQMPVEGTLLFYVPLRKDVIGASTTRWELNAVDEYEQQSQITQLVGEWVQR